MPEWDFSLRLKICLLCLCLPSLSLADNYEDILLQAFARFDDNYREAWAFTEERIFKDVTSRGRYDPRVSNSWSLLSVDGRTPTDKEVGEYLEEKSKEGNGRGAGKNRPEDMMKPESLSLIEETENYWLFDFLPAGDDNKFMEHLDGEMMISKSNQTIQFIDIRSTGSFKPRFGVRVNEFLTRIEFRPVNEEGPVVPQSMRFRIKAKAFGVMDVDERVSVSYSDYEFVGADE